MFKLILEKLKSNFLGLMMADIKEEKVELKEEIETKEESVEKIEVKEIEEWKEISSCPKYMCSNLGRIKNKKTGRIRKINYGKAKELGVNASMRLNITTNKYANVQIHRIIALTWIPTEDTSLVVIHKDGNKYNNKASNLRWGTQQEVMKQTRSNGMKQSIKSYAVLQLDLEENIIKEWDSIKGAAEGVGITGSAISGVCRGRKRTAGGFKWCYKNQVDDSEFVTINRFPNYKVSKTGVIIVSRTKLPLKQQMRNGYKVVHLKENGKYHNKNVHRIVAETFIPNPENKPQVDHISTDCLDNSVENLQWCTSSENVSNPLTKNKSKTKVAQYSKDGKLIAIFDSVNEASEATGTYNTSISKVLSGNYKTAGGFVWKKIIESTGS